MVSGMDCSLKNTSWRTIRDRVPGNWCAPVFRSIMAALVFSIGQKTLFSGGDG